MGVFHVVAYSFNGLSFVGRVTVHQGDLQAATAWALT